MVRTARSSLGILILSDHLHSPVVPLSALSLSQIDCLRPSGLQQAPVASQKDRHNRGTREPSSHTNNTITRALRAGRRPLHRIAVTPAAQVVVETANSPTATNYRPAIGCVGYGQDTSHIPPCDCSWSTVRSPNRNKVSVPQSTRRSRRAHEL